MSDFTVSRRRLLKTAGIAGLGAVFLGGGLLGLSTCRRETGGAPENPLVDIGEEAGPYGVWREMRSWLRTSPDHTLGRAAALVEAGDVVEIHRFVRDEIRLVPGRGDRFSLGSTVLWGKRAALRAGAGTAREKAEILAHLLRQTGRVAKVVEAAPLSREEAATTFFRDTEPEFAPPIGPDTFETWRRRLGARPEETITADLRQQENRVETTRTELEKLIRQQGIPRNWGQYNDRAYGRVPVVRFEEKDGQVFYADPIRPGAEIKTSLGRTSEAAAPEGLLPVVISLAFTTMDAPDQPVEVARSEWTAHDVCGRQVRLGFKPVQGTAELLASRVGDVRTFTPFLSIQAIDGEEMETEKAVHMGQTFTLSGDVMSVNEEGAVILNGQQIVAGAAPRQAQKVATVQVKADAARYPDMRLLVWPRDADGQIVDGLTQEEFSVSDEGDRMMHLLRVQDRAPSILFLSDESLSMPGEFRGDSGESMLALVESVRRAALKVHAAATVNVRATDSNLWENVIKTLGTKVDLIVYATDGHVKGRIPTAQERAPLALGPRIITMNVRGNLDLLRRRSDSNVFDEMASLTSGKALDVNNGNASAIEAAVLEFLEQEGRELPYELGYHVPGGETGMRSAGVTIGAATGEASYQAGAAVAPPKGLASLRVTVRIGDREVERVIGGHAGGGPVSQADIDHLRGAVLGTHILAFEGPPPSFSTLMDDVLTARLSFERFDRAVAEEDGMLTIIEAMEAGYHVLPGELATLMMRTGPSAGEDFCFAEQGMRCVYFASHPVLNDDKIITRVDILPTSKTYVLSPHTEVMMAMSMEAGLKLASAEAALFPGENTFDLLDGKLLTLLNSDLYASNSVSPDQIAAWDRREDKFGEIFRRPGHLTFCAQDLSTQASWVVDMETSEVYALLPDMSGGGHRARRIEQQLVELDRVVSMMNRLAQGGGKAAAGMLNPLGAHALGVAATYGQNLARIYAAASMAVILMDSRGIEPAVKLALASMACENVKTISLGVFGAGKSASRAVEVFSMAESVAGAAGAHSPFSCSM